MTGIARDYGGDHTLAFLKEGYTFASSRFHRFGCDAFETRIMQQKMVCAMGENTARMFYTPGRFTRKLALPPMALLLLQDAGSVAMRDGEHHRKRKQMFMSLMTSESMQGLMDLAHEQWQLAISEWENTPHIVLHEEVEHVLFRAAWYCVCVPKHGHANSLKPYATAASTCAKAAQLM